MTRAYGPVFFTVSKKGSGLGPDRTVASLKMIGKLHFTQLYNRAHKRMFTEQNIRSGYCKTSLHPYNLNVVLDTIDHPSLVEKGQEVETCY